MAMRLSTLGGAAGPSAITSSVKLPEVALRAPADADRPCETLSCLYAQSMGWRSTELRGPTPTLHTQPSMYSHTRSNCRLCCRPACKPGSVDCTSEPVQVQRSGLFPCLTVSSKAVRASEPPSKMDGLNPLHDGSAQAFFRGSAIKSGKMRPSEPNTLRTLLLLSDLR
jgi:hypothetical protein